MIVSLIIFAVCLFLLVKGADYFVEASAGIAKGLGVSDLVIGLTLTSLGTSIPELAASIPAAVNNHPGIIIGNVVGSNIANIGLILGVSAIVSSFKTENEMYERDGYLMMAAVVLFFVMSLDNKISSFEGVVLLLYYVFYILFLFTSKGKAMKSHRFRDFMGYVFDFEYLSPFLNQIKQTTWRKPKEKKKKKEQSKLKRLRYVLIRQIAIMIGAGLVIVFSAKYLIQEAVTIAQWLGLPENVVGISLIAVGTSVPELSVSISAVRKGHGGMVIGNILGSNIANLALIVAVASLIRPLQVSEMSVTLTIPILLFFSLGLLYFIRSDWQVARRQGMIVLALYILFLIGVVYTGVF